MRYEDINVNNSFVSTILEIHVTKENDKKKNKKKQGVIKIATKHKWLVPCNSNFSYSQGRFHGIRLSYFLVKSVQSRDECPSHFEMG